MSGTSPEGYLGADARITSGPAPELVEAGYAVELADAPLLHHGLGLADLAHVLALRRAGVIPDDDAARLLDVLLDVLDTPAEDFPYDAVYGDAYNSRERELERRLGSVAGWLHTGRTRREAGRIAFRLAMRERVLALHDAVVRFVRALVDRAKQEADTVWADTTYLQPAQPSTFGHYLGAFAEEGVRHLDRLAAAYRWFDRSPAGVGGVAGTRVPVDRDELAGLLGFADLGAHTRDVMWSVDGLADAALACTQAATTVDRLAEDLEIFASPGFGYVALDASLCRASVLLPQKRNPYALAVIRSGASTLIGRTTGLLVAQRSPSARTDNWLRAYGELASTLELSRQVVALGAEVAATMRVDRDALAAAAGAHFTAAADLAEELVLRTSVDYRSAYRVVGKAVATAVAAGRTELTYDDLALAAKELRGTELGLDPDHVLRTLDPATCTLGRDVPGGSAPERVRAHCADVAKRVSTAAAWSADRAVAARVAEDDLIEQARAVSTAE
ncbi:lyase family protein [Haloechinothrix salitolerans]|uniref:argininosuccinate lyase n=1 Tax=Haloechinothrix salitolerans TaxID=926830 RepID=A0ABW2C0X3_9PSEU